jgi:transposase
MWKPEYRLAVDRSGLPYPSDLTDAEWAIVEPMFPPAKHGGRKRTINVREILNGIFYVLSTGCQWQALPKDLPPKSTVWAYFDLWTWDGSLERIHHALYVAVREQVGRDGSQAPHPRRYARAVAERGGACRQHSGSRRSGAGARPSHASFVPVH